MQCFHRAEMGMRLLAARRLEVRRSASQQAKAGMSPGPSRAKKSIDDEQPPSLFGDVRANMKYYMYSATICLSLLALGVWNLTRDKVYEPPPVQPIQKRPVHKPLW
ncbi:hypothetical protein WR25_00052 [Diploscapter pachys]|uniref:Uncharacterized protein n=1 Tax=Diploscapter pachys TaxID=2018661 RepID=A0A2A2KEG5_9BILA|nr:hypothetical protein WR25_00052 [Diploscapter pachys]